MTKTLNQPKTPTKIQRVFGFYAKMYKWLLENPDKHTVSVIIICFSEFIENIKVLAHIAYLCLYMTKPLFNRDNTRDISPGNINKYNT